MEDIFTYPLLFLAGAISGFINMMAGGGSVLPIGLMILMGMEPSVANGTNRLGVFTATVSGATAFKTSKITDMRQSIILGCCAIPGAIIGSFYSISLSDALFQRIIAIIMILVMITMFIPKNKIKTPQTSIFIYPAMFAVGFYGGFIQAGVGFLLMAAIRHLMQVDLIKTNMHKTFVVLIYSIPVLLIFGFNGKVDWIISVLLAIGNMIGAWISVKLAIKKGEKLVKIVLSISIIIMAVMLFI